MELLRPAAQHYDWGDARLIPDLLRQPPDGRPWAELWWGTHPKGETTTVDGRPLRDVAGELPYLLKLLSAAEPLSLQSHPTVEQARAGFQREEDAGLATDSPDRIYRDPHAKPEVLCALTPFEALCGFRPFDETAKWFAEQGWEGLADRLAEGVQTYMRWALSEASPLLPPGAPSWAQRINARHPGDGGVLVALLLHHVILEPGDAVFLAAGNLHAYLNGFGVEVMGSSDNVVRGGLTTKHIDVDELLEVVRPEPLAEPVLHPTPLDVGGRHVRCFRYETGHTPFALTRVEVEGPSRHEARRRELVVCTAGDAGPIPRGHAAYLAPGDDLHLVGPATLFVAEERNP